MTPGQAAQKVGVTYATAKRWYDKWADEIRRSLESKLVPSMEESINRLKKKRKGAKPPARAKKSLEEQIKQKGLEHLFGEILIPMETIEEQKNGQKRTQKRKFAPGYIFVQMEMNDRT